MSIETTELLVGIPAIEDRSLGIIKVIGVGGGGGNAVSNMYATQQDDGISFAVCNTDSQALARTDIPVRIQLGSEGLGVGGDPQRGKERAEESMDQIEALLNDGTRMVFITAGMGGGTGTGAAPVIAQMARKRGILTVGVVTIPFAFEKRKRIEKALGGVLELKRHVDALLVINNERLMEIYRDGNTTCAEAFEHADNILSVSTRSIAEIITVEGTINCDYQDVKSVLENGGSAIISVGRGSGQHRILSAVEQALDSPLLTGVDIEHAQKMLCIVYTGSKNPVKITEMSEIQDFMETLSPDLEVYFGLYPDATLDEEVKVSIIATGFSSSIEEVELPVDNMADRIAAMKKHYYGSTKTLAAAKAKTLTAALAEADTQQAPATDVAPQTAEQQATATPSATNHSLTEDTATNAATTAKQTEQAVKTKEKTTIARKATVAEKSTKTDDVNNSPGTQKRWSKLIKEFIAGIVTEDFDEDEQD